MAKNNNLTDFLTGVADAIRTKKGTSGLINPQDFESEIASITTGTSVYDITANLTNVTAASNNVNFIASGKSVTLIFTANVNYTMPTSINVTGAVGTYTRTSDTDGTLVISNPTGDVSFSVVGEAKELTDLTGTKWKIDGIPTERFGDGLTFNITGRAISNNPSYTVASTETNNSIYFSYMNYTIFAFVPSKNPLSVYPRMRALDYNSTKSYYQTAADTNTAVDYWVLEITGGNDVTNSTLISLLKQYATQIV